MLTRAKGEKDCLSSNVASRKVKVRVPTVKTVGLGGCTKWVSLL